MRWRLGALVVLAACRCEAGVKWTPNTNVREEDRAAHDAPRSQKYWDKHGIQRPEYAKTDAEAARERRDRSKTPGPFGISGGDLMIFVLLGAIAIVVYTHVTCNNWVNV